MIDVDMFKIMVQNYTGRLVGSVVPFLKSFCFTLFGSVVTIGEGAIYNAFTAKDSRLPASGWRIWTQAECRALFASVGESSNRLKVGGNTGINLSCAGFRTNAGGYSVAGTNGFYWTGTNWDALNQTFYFNIYNGSGSLNENNTFNVNGMSVRFRKITTTLAEGKTGIYTGNDGQKYKTVCFNGVEYMSENLAETKYNDQTLISLETLPSPWSTATTALMCWFNNDITIGKITTITQDAIQNLGFEQGFYGGSLRVMLDSVLVGSAVDLAGCKTDLFTDLKLIGLTDYHNAIDNHLDVTAVEIFNGSKSFCNEILVADALFSDISLAARYVNTIGGTVDHTEKVYLQFVGFKAIFS